MGFICHGVIQAIIDGKQVMKTGIGYGSDKGKFNPGEMASKEAESDALKRAAMKLGRSLGLALYDKSQEYVDEESLQIKPETRETATAVATKPATPTAVPAPVAAVQAVANTAPAKTVPASEMSPEQHKAAIQSVKTDMANTKALRSKIKLAFKILDDQKKTTKEEFVAKYLAGGKVDTLTDDQVFKTIDLLKTNFKELSL